MNNSALRPAKTTVVRLLRAKNGEEKFFAIYPA